jgi:hypothetical protein
MEKILKLAAALFVLSLVACQSTVPAPAPASAALPEPDTCGAAAYASVLEQHKDRIPATPAGKVVRIVCSTCPMTMDFNQARLNVIYDEKTGTVSRLTCG